ncbi:ProQ/FINO family protein [Massilia sp. S19_KUP03_FR1]|uniref:ProQ/FINO family protein n=1 Tax=Massilia sp. S19_KUP03_FR1 TaxID=3025503 RepID=UPI003FA5C56F
MNPMSPVAPSADVPAAAATEAPQAIETTTPDTGTVEASPAANEASPVAPAAPAPSARTLLKQFQQQFKAFRDCLPLSIGIDKQIIARMPGIERKAMRAALGIHTGSLRYLRAMEKATVRYDLDGTAGAEVAETHRTHAKETLQQRLKKEAERKKAERDAEKVEREAAQALEADKLRQEKLMQLASKFSRS